MKLYRTATGRGGLNRRLAAQAAMRRGRRRRSPEPTPLWVTVLVTGLMAYGFIAMFVLTVGVVAAVLVLVVLPAAMIVPLWLWHRRWTPSERRDGPEIGWYVVGAVLVALALIIGSKVLNASTDDPQPLRRTTHLTDDPRSAMTASAD